MFHVPPAAVALPYDIKYCVSTCGRQAAGAPVCYFLRACAFVPWYSVTSNSEVHAQDENWRQQACVQQPLAPSADGWLDSPRELGCLDGRAASPVEGSTEEDGRAAQCSGWLPGPLEDPSIHLGVATRCLCCGGVRQPQRCQTPSRSPARGVLHRHRAAHGGQAPGHVLATGPVRFTGARPFKSQLEACISRPFGSVR